MRSQERRLDAKERQVGPRPALNLVSVSFVVFFWR